jgi:hypothetical protein
MRVVSALILSLLIFGCARQPPPTSSTAASLQRQIASVGQIPALRACQIDGEILPSDAPLKTVMSKVVNPLLTKVSVTLFHDQRRADDDARNDELANAAADLSRCMAQIADARRIEDFKLLALIESHNALALSDATRQYDRNAELHWYQHIKETCHACHNEYRFHLGSSR